MYISAESKAYTRIMGKADSRLRKEAKMSHVHFVPQERWFGPWMSLGWRF